MAVKNTAQIAGQKLQQLWYNRAKREVIMRLVKPNAAVTETKTKTNLSEVRQWEAKKECRTPADESVEYPTRPPFRLPPACSLYHRCDVLSSQETVELNLSSIPAQSQLNLKFNPKLRR